MQECFICYTDSLKSGFISLCGQDTHKFCLKCLLQIPSDEAGKYCCPMCRKESEFQNNNDQTTVVYSKSGKNRFLEICYNCVRTQFLKIVIKTEDKSIKIRENWVRPFCSHLLPTICHELVVGGSIAECDFGCYRLSIKRNQPPFNQQIEITVANI